MIVLVGGQASKVGKTTAVCAIIDATREARWTAVKITPHAHGEDLTAPVIREEIAPGTTTDTARYLQAGAVKAFWIRARAADLADVVPREGNVIVESNALAAVLVPDLFLFITAPGAEWKDSSLCIEKADYVLEAVTPPLIERIRRLSLPASARGST